MKYYREIVLAIENYKNDIKKYPIYFKLKDLKYLDSDEAIAEISEKLTNADYQPESPQEYYIPYDTLSTRIACYLNIEDLIIRYFIVNILKRNIDLYSNQINLKDFKVYCIVDIYDCYNQIEKETFLATIKSEYNYIIGDQNISLISQCLNYKNQYSNNIGAITIGSKPDEYFAELFLSILHSKININISDNISRNGDEFLIGANSVNELRYIVSKIDETLIKYGLKINKSKNSIRYTFEKRNITRVLPFEEPWPYTSPSCPPPNSPTILYKELNYTKTTEENKIALNFHSINSYESSIEYLKSISIEVEKIENLTKKYSRHLLFGHWNSSTPTEAKKLYEAIDFENILNPVVLDNLETIIYRYPRSQYFSALAIKNVCIYAKNMDYSYTNSCENNDANAFIFNGYDFLNYNSKTSSFLCEKSNSILLNALRSSEIFDYQKYLILRELYFDKKKLNIDKVNYKLNGEIPFPILFEKELIRLLPDELESETPLTTIINEILNL